MSWLAAAIFFAVWAAMVVIGFVAIVGLGSSKPDDQATRAGPQIACPQIVVTAMFRSDPNITDFSFHVHAAP